MPPRQLPETGQFMYRASISRANWVKSPVVRAIKDDYPLSELPSKGGDSGSYVAACTHTKEWSGLDTQRLYSRFGGIKGWRSTLFTAVDPWDAARFPWRPLRGEMGASTKWRL